MRLRFRTESITPFLRARDKAEPAPAVQLSLEGRAHLVREDDYVPSNDDVSSYAQWVALPATVSFVSESQWPDWRKEYRELLELIDQWSPERIAAAMTWLDKDSVNAMIAYEPYRDDVSPQTEHRADSVSITVRLLDAEYVALQRWLNDALRFRFPLPHVLIIGMHFGRSDHSIPTWAEFTSGLAFVPASYARIDLAPTGDAPRR